MHLLKIRLRICARTNLTNLIIFVTVVTVTVAQLNSALHLGYSLAGEGSVSEVNFKLLTFSRELRIEKNITENESKYLSNAKILKFLPEVKS